MATSPQQYPASIVVDQTAGPVDAEVTLPGSKSITNRALIIAALADGRTTLREALFSDDTRYMCESLQRLGISVESDAPAERFVVDGQGGRIPSPHAKLFIGNSGTSARFLAALVALGNGLFEIDGIERMRQRPMEPLLLALRDLGINAYARDGTGCPPIVIESESLAGGAVSMAGDTSSQYFTALLIVAPVTERGITIEVTGDLVSKPYLDMTIRTMRDFGVDVRNYQYQRFMVPGQQRYTPREYGIEPDASAASYFFALAAVSGGRIRVNNLGTTSAQGDVAFVDVLERMGCTVHREETFIEMHGPDCLSGVDIDMNAISDTVPTLAAIAPLASGPVSIRNVEHIRHKETDRISAVVTELRRLRIDVEEHQDGMIIHPGRPQPAKVMTYDDHRMAMSFAILGTQVDGLEIDDPGCVAKTFPDFFERLAVAIHR